MKRILPTGLALSLAAFTACQTQTEKPIDPAQGGVMGESAEVGSTAPGAQDSVELAQVLDDEEPLALDDESFLTNAFPPMLPVNEAHAGSWLREDCILCHETGVAGAPILVHRGMPKLLKQAKCRTCHVPPDADASPLTNMKGEGVSLFNADAFPPVLPMDESHANAWMREDCLLCHEWGVAGAPKVRHSGMTELLLQAKCRTCHLPSGNANGL